MKTNLLMALPVAAVLALGGCGGGDDGPGVTSGNGSGTGGGDSGSSSVITTGVGSITACFTANNTVSYAMASSGTGSAYKQTVGPMTYNGQAVTGNTMFYSDGNKQTQYWTVTDSGVTKIAKVNSDGTVMTDGSVFIPQDIKPGQVVINHDNNDSITFIGFETFTLAGKTFYSTCHIKASVTQGGQADFWYAPGYGEIKVTDNGGTAQYNGNL